MTETRKKYDEEFKKRAVRMSFSSERTVKQVAESLGISSNMLYRWRKKYTIKQRRHNSRMKCVSYVCEMLNWKRKTTY